MLRVFLQILGLPCLPYFLPFLVDRSLHFFLEDQVLLSVLLFRWVPSVQVAPFLPDYLVIQLLHLVQGNHLGRLVREDLGFLVDLMSQGCLEILMILGNLGLHLFQVLPFVQPLLVLHFDKLLHFLLQLLLQNHQLYFERERL